MRHLLFPTPVWNSSFRARPVCDWSAALAHLCQVILLWWCLRYSLQYGASWRVILVSASSCVEQNSSISCFTLFGRHLHSRDKLPFLQWQLRLAFPAFLKQIYASANLCFKRKLRQTFLFLSIREKLLPVSWYFAHAQGSPSNTGKLGLGGEVIISDFERTDCKTVFNHSLTCCFECLISFIGTFSCLSSGVVSLSAFAL